MARDLLTFVVIDPEVAHGQAILRGTRVPVSMILECFAAGMNIDEILAEYPSVTVEGIRAAAAYGAMLARDERVPVDPAPKS